MNKQLEGERKKASDEDMKTMENMMKKTTDSIAAK